MSKVMLDKSCATFLAKAKKAERRKPRERYVKELYKEIDMDSKIIKKYNDISIEAKTYIDIIFDKLDIRDNDRVKVLQGIIFHGIISNYSAFMLLQGNKFYIESSTILRSAVELLFIFKSLHKKPNETLDRLDNHLKYISLNQIKNTIFHGKYPELLETAKSISLDELKDASKTMPWKWAELGECIDYYDYAYSILSNYSHANLISLEKRLKRNGEKFEISSYFDYEEQDLLFFTMYAVLIECFEVMNNEDYYKLKDKIEVMKEKLNSYA